MAAFRFPVLYGAGGVVSGNGYADKEQVDEYHYDDGAYIVCADVCVLFFYALAADVTGVNNIAGMKRTFFV